MYTNYKEQFWGDWHVTLQNTEMTLIRQLLEKDVVIYAQLYSDFFDLIKKFFKQFD